MRSDASTVAIVGGGALGAALASVLAERLSRIKPRIVLFEKSEHVGRGVAYAKDRAPYLLNTSAQSMSLVPGRRAHFFEWLKERGLAPEEGGDHFCARETFGDYVEDCVAGSIDKARRRGIHVSTVRDEVTILTSRAQGGYRVVTRAHAPVDADVVVLALGNLPSKKMSELAGPSFFSSPYPSSAFCPQIPADSSVAIVGTGLSAIDAAIALCAAGHTGPVTMASRSGLLPSVRGPLFDYELRHVTRANIVRATEGGRQPLSCATILRFLEQEFEEHGLSVSWDRDFPGAADPRAQLTREIAAAESGARLWQSIGEALNPIMDVLWHHLAADDRRMFLERYRSRFMSHWVPIPLVTAKRVLTLMREDKLHVSSGLRAITRDGSGYRAELAHRSARFDFVINATGAPRHLHESDSLLLESLLEEGTIAPHECGGLRVDFDSLRVQNADGRTDPSLFALGNLTCGTHLFTSTLDLNVEKADRIAAQIEGELTRRLTKEPHVDATPHPS